MISLNYQEYEYDGFGHLRAEGKIGIVKLQIGAYEPEFYAQFLVKMELHKQAESLSDALRSLADLLDKQYRR